MISNLGGEPILDGPCAKEQYGYHPNLLDALPLLVAIYQFTSSLALGFDLTKAVYIR